MHYFHVMSFFFDWSFPDSYNFYHMKEKCQVWFWTTWYFNADVCFDSGQSEVFYGLCHYYLEIYGHSPSMADRIKSPHYFNWFRTIVTMFIIDSSPSILEIRACVGIPIKFLKLTYGRCVITLLSTIYFLRLYLIPLCISPFADFCRLSCHLLFMNRYK